MKIVDSHPLRARWWIKRRRQNTKRQKYKDNVKDKYTNTIQPIIQIQNLNDDGDVREDDDDIDDDDNLQCSDDLDDESLHQQI